MATASRGIERSDEIETPEGAAFVVLEGVSWSGYESVLKWVGERPINVSYDRGVLQILSPSSPHEERKKLLAVMVEAILDEREIPSRSLGSTTFKKKELGRGLEPDDCYYIENYPRVRGRKKITLKTDPPPDLVLEVDIWSSSVLRLEIYSALGVSEVIIHREGALEFLRLGPKGTYVASASCRGIPGFDARELTEWLERGEGQDHTAWRKAFRAWVRKRIDETKAK